MINFSQVRQLGRVPLDRLRTIPKSSLIWESSESDPTKHDDSHQSLIYRLPQTDFLTIYGRTSPFDKHITQHYETLGLFPMMIRKPALTAFDYYRRANFNAPNIRLLLYGNVGHGKTHSLAHIVHYLHNMKDCVILQIRDLKKLLHTPQEHTASITRPGRIDTPIETAIALKQFSLQNAYVLGHLGANLACSRDYKWSAREITSAGEPLMNVAEHAVNRVTHATDCFAVLLKELAIAANNGIIRLVTILDDVAYLFDERAGELKHKDYKFMYTDELTAARAIKKLVKGSHKNSMLIAACDRPKTPKALQTPKHLLGLEGWNSFDPFLPIHVPEYSREEFESHMNMLQDIDWITRPEARTEEMRDELRFVSGMNPLELDKLCRHI